MLLLKPLKVTNAFSISGVAIFLGALGLYLTHIWLTTIFRLSVHGLVFYIQEELCTKKTEATHIWVKQYTHRKQRLVRRKYVI